MDAALGVRACVRRGGFTLIELLVAVLITAAIAGGATMAIAQSLRAREGSRARQEVASRVDAAVSRIAADVQNVIRSGDLFDARVLLVNNEAGDVAHDELLLFTGSARRARPSAEQNEGGSYEAQYRLEAPRSSGDAGYVLWRRLDPVPDRVPDGGGIASPIVEGIVSLSIDALDGETWRADWDSDRDGYPHALRIAVAAQADGGSVVLHARRVIALDRTPLPFATALEAAAGSPGGSR